MLKKSKKSIVVLPIILSLLLTISACATSGTSSSAPTATVKDTLTTIIPDDFTTLDPQKLPSNAEINFCANIFDTLVSYDSTANKITPDLAQSWTANADGTAYTFKLVPGVKFQNGDPLTANDVAFTAQRFMTEEWMKPYSFMIKDTKVVDDNTITFNLKYSYSKFLSMLKYMYVIDQKEMQTAGDSAAKNPVGTGAYSFVKWENGQDIVLKANPDYFKGAAPIKNLVFKIITDSNTAFVALQNGEADMTFSITTTDFAQVKNDSKLATDTTLSNNFYYLNFNSNKIPQKVRQALSYAINRDAINTMVNEGTGTVANMCLKEGEEGYTTDIATYPYNPDKAKELLKAASVDPSSLKLDFFYGQTAANNRIGQSLQADFAAIGVNIQLKPVETGTWWQLFGDGNYTMSRSGYPLEPNNADFEYYDMFDKNGTFNVSRINDPDINDLLEKGRREIDPAKRSADYVKVNQILAENAYVVPLYFTPSLVAYNKNLKNVKAVSNQEYLYRDYSW